MRQWTRLPPDQQAWLVALLRGTAPGAWFASDEAAQFWCVDIAVADRRIWILQYGDWVESVLADQAQQNRWRVARLAHPTLAQLAS